MIPQTNQKPQPWLNNGIPEDRSTVFVYDGVIMRYFKDQIQDIKDHATRYAPFFTLQNGLVTALDWAFYAHSGEEARQNMDKVLWAASILTSEALNAFTICDVDNKNSHWAPSIGRTYLYFERSRVDDAKKYASIVLPLIEEQEHFDLIALAGETGDSKSIPPLRPLKLEIKYCMAEAQFVTISP